VGGEFIFTDHKEEVSVENNCLIMFPSCIHHEVTPVKMINEVKPLSGYGRYTVSQFFSMR
jgi:hypothetical protein